MYFNFQQYRVSRSVKTVRTNIFAKKCSYQWYFILNRLLMTCIIIKRTCMRIISIIGLVDQSKPCTQTYLLKFASCINMQLPIVILAISIISDMHHRKTYMHINFQQNRVNRSVKTVRTNLFAKNCKLHTFATTNSIFKDPCAQNYFFKKN